MAEAWQPVFQGPSWRAWLAQARLDAEGIPTFVPAANTKTIDPFITGGAVLDVEIHVPAWRREDAEAILSEPVDAAPPEDARAAELDKVGERIRYASLLVVLAPYALYLAARQYFPAVRSSGIRPRQHGLTVAAVWLASASTVLLLGMILSQPFAFGGAP